MCFRSGDDRLCVYLVMTGCVCFTSGDDGLCLF